jgi:hypothetical protein
MIKLICVDHGLIETVSVDALPIVADRCPYCGQGLWQMRDPVIVLPSR